MKLSTRSYALGTELVQSFPFGYYVGGKVLCSDGQVRSLKRIGSTADTFFSIPASVTVAGRTVAGYVTFDTDASGEQVACFVAHSYRRNGHLLPGLKAAALSA